MNKKQKVFGITISILIAIVGYFTTIKYVFPLDIPKIYNLIYFLSLFMGPLFIFSFIISATKKKTVAPENKESRNNEKESKEPLVKLRRYYTDDPNAVEYLDRISYGDHKEGTLTSDVQRIFSGISKANILFTGKAMIPSFGCYFYHNLIEGLSSSNMNVVVYKETEINDVINVFKSISKNNLPSFIFVDIGKRDVERNINLTLRDLKKESPEIKIYIMYSGFYFQEKGEVIKALIDDGIAEKDAFADNLFSYSNYEGSRLLKEIRECLA
jgi:hypothetical protein